MLSMISCIILAKFVKQILTMLWKGRFKEVFIGMETLWKRGGQFLKGAQDLLEKEIMYFT